VTRVDSRDELVDAFTTAVTFALREMANVEAAVGAVRRSTAADRCAAVAAVVRLTASGGEGRLTLSVPEPTAANLARRVLTEVSSDVTADMVRDCMGEVANVVAGQAKTLLVGTPSHFTLSTPSVHVGGSVGPETGGWVLPFESDAGAFTVYVSLPL
jgi:chemotaxis protein CheX